MTDNLHRLFFKAFSNITRLDIIDILRSRPMTVNDLSEDLGFEQSRVSHNLKCLENCGFVNAKQNGKYRIYSLDEETILPIINLFDKHIKKYKNRLSCCEVISK